ncbi:TrkA family potassium uptake protein [Pendulispora brunnea]|uniref:Trk system potassium uptake protein TrkA n=1 Tax=Pendulispora brunnea TaxID=2905690 RepID=A0ABZ2KL45_9BACT
MRVLIAGAGRAGLSVGGHLRTTGHEVIIIDRDPLVAKQAFERHGLVAITGDATDAGLLQEADVSRSDVVVAMLARDADNLAVALLARSAGAQRVMVRMRDSQYRNVYLDAGVHRIVSEIEIFVGGIATAIEHDAVKHSMILGGGSSVAFELTIPEGADVVGRPVAEIAASKGFPPSCVFAGLYDANGAVDAPRGSSVLRGGMTVLIVARRDEVGAVIRHLMSPRILNAKR